MAYRRGIIARTKLFYEQQQRVVPLFSHFSNSDREELHTNSVSRNSEIRSYIHNRYLITRNNFSNSQLSRNVFQVRRSEIGVGYGLVFHRNLSSASGGERVPFEIEILNDTEVFNGVVGVMGDKAVEAAPVVNEVAVAAVHSFSPVAALQYLVDYVHCFTGYNWWASIAVTTLLFRFIELPLDILYQKLNFRHHLHAILLATANKLINKDDPASDLEEVLASLCQFANKFAIPFYGVGISFVIKCWFFFAILNMAEEVPSFITGGTLWFLDLTTADRIYLPSFLGLAFWINLKVHVRRHVKGVHTAHMIQGALIFLGSAAVGFPNAMYCYWITSNLFSIAFSPVKVNPQVQKLLGISPPSNDIKPAEASSKSMASSSDVDPSLRKGEKGRKK